MCLVRNLVFKLLIILAYFFIVEDAVGGDNQGWSIGLLCSELGKRRIYICKLLIIRMYILWLVGRLLYEGSMQGGMAVSSILFNSLLGWERLLNRQTDRNGCSLI